MKKIIILFAAAVLFASCDKFLTREPLDFMSPETSYETESALDKALAGVYDMLGHRNLYGGYFLYNCGFDADDGHFARNSPSTGPAVYNFSSTDVTVYYVWESLYKGVSRANMLLANVDNNPEIPVEYREVVRGHAVVKQVFDLGKEGVVAGCLVNDGFITTKGQIRVMRHGKLLHTGGIGTIRHFKESVEEVKMAQECGIMLDSFKTFQEGDVLECFAFEELPKTL